MRLSVADSAEEAGRAAAREAVSLISGVLAARAHCIVALSRVESASPFLAAFRRGELDWARLHVIQVDERVVPLTDARRNALHLRQALVEQGPLPSSQLHAMPVEAEDLERGAHEYEQLIVSLTGKALELDLVHLGLGADGHTASLVPGDRVLEETTRCVAGTAPYEGLRRMTLTYPLLNTARQVLWLVTGESKANAVRQLVEAAGDGPAMRVSRTHALLVADRAAAALVRFD